MEEDLTGKDRLLLIFEVKGLAVGLKGSVWYCTFSLATVDRRASLAPSLVMIQDLQLPWKMIFLLGQDNGNMTASQFANASSP